MGQKYIRQNAGLSVFRRAWLRLHEPRVISSVYGVMYLAATIVGAYSIFVPPNAIEAAANGALTALIAATMTLGGVWGLVSVLNGVYWAERPGQWFLLAGLIGFWGTVLYAAISRPDDQGANIFALFAITAAIGFFAIRFYWTTSEPYNIHRFIRWPIRKRRHDNERR